MAVKAARAAAVQAAVNFGDFSNYVTGGGLPEGNYALEFSVQKYQAQDRVTGANRGAERLGIMVSAHSLTNSSEAPRQQFYSMGSKAIESWAPDPETGKQLVALPNGDGSTTWNLNTNWAIFLKHLYDCGLPPGVFTNDISVLDGIHVHLVQIPEPEERKGFQSAKTSEVAEEPRRANKISVPSEILPNGAPWEGGGGIPVAGEAAPAAKTTAKPAAKPAAKPTAAAPVQEAGGLSDDELMELALNSITSVIESSANPSSILKPILRTSTFKAAKKASDDASANAVMTAFFSSDDTLNDLLGSVGYMVDGSKVVPIPE